MNKTIKLLELFGGIGAPRSALENLNTFHIKSVDYVEILPNAVKVYNAMYDTSYKPQDILEWNLNVDLLVHGSPCQDFSQAGFNDIQTGRSILYQRTLEIIEKELKPRPKYVLWENVVGLVHQHYEHFNHYIMSMEEYGYKSYYSILEAREFGIPQTRPRVFVVSIRKDINQTFDFDCLERKPLIPLKEILTECSFDNKETTYKECENYFVIPRKKDKVLADGSYHRVWKIDKFIGTILASLVLKVGQVNENQELEYRNLTAYECWLLQGYSKEQYNKVKSAGISDSKLYSLIGNSICVPVLEAIFKELLIDKRSKSNQYRILSQYTLFEDIENYKEILKGRR